MNHKLLTKFVFSGMQKNKKTLIPYLLAGTMTVMIYYILQSLAHCPYIYKDGVEAFYGAQREYPKVCVNLQTDVR